MARTVCEEIASFLVMNILERADQLERAGNRVIHLEIGQPDFATPDCVKEAAIAAIRDGRTAYTHSMGILPLREAIAEYYAARCRVTVSPEQILTTNGTSPAMMTFFSVLCERGDSVLMPTPTYACYDSFVRYAGGIPLRVPTREEDGFQFDPAKARAAVRENTRAILFNSPSNPAGTVISRADMLALADIGPMLVSDEIYHGLVYEGEAVSALEVTDNCCVLDGVSKRYAMTGWRLCWMVAPPSLVPMLRTLEQNFFICPNSISQWAALAAIRHAWPDVERMAAEYNRRRLVMLNGLAELGFNVRSNPVGAFYILADARHLTRPGQDHDSLSLAFDILEKAHVGVAPGVDFGQEAEGYLRFCYANSTENIEEAMERLRLYLQNRN
jgi:aspartate/methionine/tyrosine aminotransferase